MWMNWWIGRGPYHRQPDGWPATGAPQGRGGEPRTSSSDRAAPAGDLVAQSQVWGFSTAAAHRAAHGRTWKDLLTGWRTTAEMLGTERTPSRRLALVMLRAAILDEMEAQRPEAFAAWLAEEHGTTRPRRGRPGRT